MHTYLKKLGFSTVDAGFYGHIREWLEWYRGKVSSFHSYSQYNGKRRVGRERATLGMAKKVCEDWANLLFNEKAEFTVSDLNALLRAREILDGNNFRVRANQMVEMAFALGTGAFVEYRDRGRVVIDDVRADMIYPISWSGRTITECAFGSEKMIGGRKCVYLQLHLLERGRYMIYNRLFDRESMTEMKLPDSVAEVYKTGSKQPLFQIITPNIINNLDLDNPMGISVYANAIDLLKGVDLVYDSYQNEFRLGKKRVIVPAGMAQLHSGETGLMPIFDDNDVEFYAMSDKSLTDLREINMEIRADEHRQGLAQNLSLLSDKCGLGGDRYSFERGSVKTATEVISEKSDLFQNLRKHELVLSKALRDLVRAVLYLDGNCGDYEVSVDFDDSIIVDRQAEFDERMKLLGAGVLQKWELRAWWCNEDEATARAAVEAGTA